MPTTQTGSPGPYGLKLLTPAAIEPITLVQAKAQLRVEVPDDDQYITDLIEAARELCEDWIDQAFLNQTWLFTLDTFPPWHFDPTGWHLRNAEIDAILREVQAYGVIAIPRPPLQSITSITYVDTTGTTQLMDPSQYQVDTVKRPGRLAPVFGTIWPATLPRIQTVSITFVAGYGALATNVPAKIRLAMRIALSQWYQNRADPGELPAAAIAMLTLGWHGTC